MMHIQSFEDFFSLREGVSNDPRVFPTDRAKTTRSWPLNIRDLKNQYVIPILGEDYTRYSWDKDGPKEFTRLKKQYGVLFPEKNSPGSGSSDAMTAYEWDLEFATTGRNNEGNGFVMVRPDRKVIYARAVNPNRSLESYLFVKN